MKDASMYTGLDRDTGRDDRAATPATRGDAERALRDFGAGDYATGTSNVVEKTSEDACEGLCPECALEAALAEASAKGIKPDQPEFGEIFERIFAEGNPGGEVKLRFLGAHKIGEPMPDELKDKLDEAGVDPFPGFPFSASELEELVRTMPPMPSIFDAIKPGMLGSPMLMLPPLTPFREPSNPTIGGDPMDLPGLDELLGRIHGRAALLSEPMTLETTKEDDATAFDQERRDVTQDLASAAADMGDLVGRPGSEDAFAALRDIAALARDTYEI